MIQVDTSQLAQHGHCNYASLFVSQVWPESPNSYRTLDLPHHRTTPTPDPAKSYMSDARCIPHSRKTPTPDPQMKIISSFVAQNISEKSHPVEDCRPDVENEGLRNPCACWQSDFPMTTAPPGVCICPLL